MITLMLPVVLASLIVCLVALPLNKLNPLTAAVIAASTLLMGAVACIAVLLHFSMYGVTAIPIIGRHLHNIFHLEGIHVTTNDGPIGFVFLAISTSALIRIARLLNVRRRLCALHPGGTLILEDRQLFAYTLPGRNSAIVMSRGLVESLNSEQLAVVQSHEEAHARWRHDIWKLLGLLCTIINPILIPMRKHLECALEKIADNSAAAACGSRRMVAETIAKLALQSAAPSQAIAIATASVPKRVQALTLNTPPNSIMISLYVWCGTIVVMLHSAFQWHHIFEAIKSVCNF
jgi:hypothetical protein